MPFTKTSDVSYRPIKQGEEVGIVDLVLKVFTQFVAPHYSQEGVVEFKKVIRPDAVADRLRAGNLILVAESAQNVIGAIEVRENSHVALLFVENSYQRKGVGKELIRRSIDMSKTRKPDLNRITEINPPTLLRPIKRLDSKASGMKRL